MVAADPRLTTPPIERPLVLYKGTCPFCRASARFLARLDRHERLALLPFEDADAAPFLSPFSDEERDESWHLFLPDGAHLIKGAASVGVLEHLPGMAWPARILRALRLVWLIDALYWIVSNSRARLSRFMSGAPGPRRYP